MKPPAGTKIRHVNTGEILYVHACDLDRDSHTFFASEHPCAFDDSPDASFMRTISTGGTCLGWSGKRRDGQGTTLVRAFVWDDGERWEILCERCPHTFAEHDKPVVPVIPDGGLIAVDVNPCGKCDVPGEGSRARSGLHDMRCRARPARRSTLASGLRELPPLETKRRAPACQVGHEGSDLPLVWPVRRHDVL